MSNVQLRDLYYGNAAPKGEEKGQTLPTPALFLPSLHDSTTRVLLLGARIECLALCAQIGALSYQVIDLLSPLQHALDGLVQHDLGLVQFLLDLHDAVRLARILACV